MGPYWVNPRPFPFVYVQLIGPTIKIYISWFGPNPRSSLIWARWSASKKCSNALHRDVMFCREERTARGGRKSRRRRRRGECSVRVWCSSGESNQMQQCSAVIGMQKKKCWCSSEKLMPSTQNEVKCWAEGWNALHESSSGYRWIERHECEVKRCSAEDAMTCDRKARHCFL